MAEEENVKKIRELDSFEEVAPMTTGDFLIVASTVGPLATKKASIKEVVDVYNFSLVAEDPDSLIEDPANPGETIKDPEYSPGIENDLDDDGEPDEKIDTTPINAGNLENFLNPDGGLEIIQECRTKDTKEIVGCDDPSAYYKTKKISTSGFEGYAQVKRKGGFLDEAYTYKSGILKEITYGKGSFLKYFTKAAAGWFQGNYEDNPDFDSLDVNALDDPLQFWYLISNFTDGTLTGWVYVLPVPIYSGDYLLESFWAFHETLDWFFLMPENFPWFYATGTIDGAEIGWAYLHPTTSGKIWIKSLEEWRTLSDLDAPDTSGDVGPDKPLPTELPSISERPVDNPPPQ